jgi:hypothetical protein
MTNSMGTSIRTAFSTVLFVPAMALAPVLEVEDLPMDDSGDKGCQVPTNADEANPI